MYIKTNYNLKDKLKSLPEWAVYALGMPFYLGVKHTSISRFIHIKFVYAYLLRTCLTLYDDTLVLYVYCLSLNTYEPSSQYLAFQNYYCWVSPRKAEGIMCVPPLQINGKRWAFTRSGMTARLPAGNMAGPRDYGMSIMASPVAEDTSRTSTQSPGTFAYPDEKGSGDSP